MAVTDSSGKPVTSASRWNTPAVTYQVSTRITSGDPKADPSGVQFHLMLIEAATCHVSLNAAMPDLTALGL